MFENIKNKIKSIEEIEAYVHYVYDREKWESKLYPISKIKPIIEFKEYKEIYKLDSVAYYLNGKPVFLLLRGIPFSLEMKETEQILTLKGYSASEIEAKINSIYTNHVFRKGSLQFKDYLVLLLTNIITGLAIYIITFMSFLAKSNQEMPISNSTIVGG